jgi:U3 small nucleolar RNA-associated protein 12
MTSFFSPPSFHLRFREHKDMITDVVFLESRNLLLTSSKDTLIKMWDLETHHCIQTLVGHRGEVWSMDVNQAQTRLITGSSDNRIRVWSLDTKEFATIVEELVVAVEIAPAQSDPTADGTEEEQQQQRMRRQAAPSEAVAKAFAEVQQNEEKHKQVREEEGKRKNSRKIDGSEKGKKKNERTPI